MCHGCASAWLLLLSCLLQIRVRFSFGCRFLQAQYGWPWVDSGGRLLRCVDGALCLVQQVSALAWPPARIASALRDIVCTDELAQVKEGTDELAQLKEGNNVCSKLPFFVWQPALEDVFRAFRLVVPSSRRSLAITSTCIDKCPFMWPI